MREGRWCPSVPVGHPEGAETRGTSANAILQLSKLPSDEKSEMARDGDGRGGLSTGIEELRARGSFGLICQISFHASESGRDQLDGVRYRSADIYQRSRHC